MSSNIDARIDSLRRVIAEKRSQLTHLYRQRKPESIRDYELVDSEGTPVLLSELFAGHDDLILIHNMGRACAYCTMWADGFNGFVRHFEGRAGFAVASPDPPEVQRVLKHERGWGFRMVSTRASTLTSDFRYLVDGELWPGVSALHRNENGSLVRTNHDRFSPYDDYNAAWHLFNLLDGGARDWAPDDPAD